MGNLICDAMLWKTQGTGTQICITNGGGNPTTPGPCDVTVGGILTVLPFGNQIATLGLTGAHVIDAWRTASANTPPWRPRVASRRSPASAIASTWRARPLTAFCRRTSGTLTAASVLIDPDAVYTITTNDFMRRGGDGYTVFRDYAINPYDFWAVMADSVMEYIEMPEAAGGLNGVITEAMYPRSRRRAHHQALGHVNRCGASRYRRHLHQRRAAGCGLRQRPDHVGWLQQPDAPAGEDRSPVCDDVHACIPDNAWVDGAYLYLHVFEGRGFSNWDEFDPGRVGASSDG